MQEIGTQTGTDTHIAIFSTNLYNSTVYDIGILWCVWVFQTEKLERQPLPGATAAFYYTI